MTGVARDGARICRDKMRAAWARCGAESRERTAGAERAQKGAKDPRPVWIGAGVGVYFVVRAAIQHCQRSDQETVYFLHRRFFAFWIASAWVAPVTKSNCIAFSPYLTIFSSSDRSAKGNNRIRITATIKTTSARCKVCRRHRRREERKRNTSLAFTSQGFPEGSITKRNIVPRCTVWIPEDGKQGFCGETVNKGNCCGRAAQIQVASVVVDVFRREACNDCGVNLAGLDLVGCHIT